MKILIKSNDISLEAELNDSSTAKAIGLALPIEGRVNRWGEEVYFDIPVSMELEDGARAEVEVGELGYWPTGNAFCVFFGRTPASDSDKPVAASAVNIVGAVKGEATVLGKTANGDAIRLIEAD